MYVRGTLQFVTHRIVPPAIRALCDLGHMTSHTKHTRSIHEAYKSIRAKMVFKVGSRSPTVFPEIDPNADVR